MLSQSLVEIISADTRTDSLVELSPSTVSSRTNLYPAFLYSASAACCISAVLSSSRETFRLGIRLPRIGAFAGVEARSLDQVKEFLRQDTTVFPNSVQTIKLLIAEGNLVAAWTIYEGTQRGPMGPFPPSGRKAQFDFGAVFRIEDGKIAEWWVTWDNMTILRALGHLRMAEQNGNLKPDWLFRNGGSVFG
jgi:predicted ester cyclase